MKKFFVLVALVLGTQLMMAQAQKTFVKSFNLDGNNFVVVKLDGEVEVKEWNESIVRVHTNVELENGTSSVLKQFLMLGRYNLNGELINGDYVIESAKRVKDVKYKGQILQERVTYTVFVPANVEVLVEDDESTTAVGNTNSSL